MSTVLIGYRGAGKTTIGRKLADRLWQKFVDVDDLIVAKAGGKPIRQIFEEHGEPHFRELEAEAVRDVAAMQDVVIGLGGGTLMREENRQVLKAAGHRLIYLKCDPVELHKRISADPQSALTRPPLTDLGGGLEEIKQVLAEREPVYRQVMDAELEITYLTPEDAVVYIVRLL
jgi:shikimate kinase